MAMGMVRGLGVLVGATLMLSGCAAVGGAPGATQPEILQATAAPASSGPASPAVSGPTESDRPSGASSGPASAAAMVCGDEIRARIAQILALPAAPVPSSMRAGGLFTCTYRLPEGALVLSVQESAGPAAARDWAQRAVAALPGAAPIEGLANLGLPGYQAPAGMVAFAKHNFALIVDATALSEPVGPHSISRSSLAYQVATDVLACWSE